MTASGSASFVSLHFSPRLLLASDLQKACHQNLLGSGHRRNCSLLFSCSRMTRPSSQAARLMFQRANVYSGCAISCSSGPQHVLPGSLPSRSSRICPAFTVRARTVRTRLSLRRSQQTQRERVALAKQLVDNGEAARWTKEPRGHSSFWSIVTACRPSGPPLIKDLFALAKPKDRYESLRGVPLEATLLLQHKGLLCRLDILQGNPGMAGPGLWAYRDPPIVKYARAGSQAILVLPLLEAGAKVDHCLMWHEETCGVAKTTTGVATRHSWQQHARATTTSAACSSVTAPARTTNAATTMICTTRRRRLRRDAAAIPRRQRSSTASLRDVSSIPCTRAESCAPGSSVSSWLYQRTMRFSGFYGCMMLRENKVRPHGPRPSQGRSSHLARSRARAYWGIG